MENQKTFDMFFCSNETPADPHQDEAMWQRILIYEFNSEGASAKHSEGASAKHSEGVSQEGDRFEDSMPMVD